MMDSIDCFRRCGSRVCRSRVDVAVEFVALRPAYVRAAHPHFIFARAAGHRQQAAQAFSLEQGTRARVPTESPHHDIRCCFWSAASVAKLLK